MVPLKEISKCHLIRELTHLRLELILHIKEAFLSMQGEDQFSAILVGPVRILLEIEHIARIEQI